MIAVYGCYLERVLSDLFYTAVVSRQQISRYGPGIGCHLTSTLRVKRRRRVRVKVRVRRRVRVVGRNGLRMG